MILDRYGIIINVKEKTQMAKANLLLCEEEAMVDN
jgi:hypothetical protein